MIKYVCDEDGNKLEVQLPIDLWDEIKLKAIDEHYQEEFEQINQEESLYHKDYLLIHYLDIINLLLYENGKNTKEVFENYFSYYNSLSAYDIELLYIFRNGSFFNIQDDDNLNILADTYRLTNQRNIPITKYQYNEILTESHRRNEISFLQYFKMNFKINKEIKTTRLNRKTERDRLFIFDMLHSAYVLESIAHAKGLEKTKSGLNIIKKEIMNELANFFYNGNKTQIHRANREATKRIEKTLEK